MPYLVSLTPLLFKNISNIGSWKHFVFVFVYVYMYLSLFSLHLGHCHHQMISFKKLCGFYGLEYHTVGINGDVTMGERPTN